MSPQTKKLAQTQQWYNVHNLLARLQEAARYIPTLDSQATLAKDYGDDETCSDLCELVEILEPFTTRVVVVDP